MTALVYLISKEPAFSGPFDSTASAIMDIPQEDDAAIRFVASVYKAGTLADNGIRVVFDLPEGSIEALAKLVACQQSGVYLHIDATAFVKENLTNLGETTETTTEESPSPVDSRRTTKRRDQRARGGV